MRQKDFKRHLARFQKCLTSSVRNPGTEQEDRYYHFDTELCMGKEKKLNPYYESLSSFMYNLDCDNNSRYKYTTYAIQAIIDAYDDLDQMEDDDDPMYDGASNDIDCYTYDLTKWLNASVNNVYYLSDVLSEYGPKDGFEALTMAQGKCIEEIYLGVKNTIVEFLKNKEIII